jgi:CheY-like chemotaxis protein
MPMLPQHVLVVEDEYLVALDVETALLAKGTETVVIATSLAQATASLNEKRPDCVLLDVSLPGGNSFDMARHLIAQDIPFGFISGYSDTSDFPQDVTHVPLLGKPFGEDDLQAFVSGLLVRE